MNDYKLVDITAMNMAQIEAELNNETKSLYYYKDIVTVGNNIYLILTPKSLSR